MISAQTLARLPGFFAGWPVCSHGASRRLVFLLGCVVGTADKNDESVPGWLDASPGGQVVRGRLEVSGWAKSALGDVDVRVVLDDGRIAVPELSRGPTSPDAALVFLRRRQAENPNEGSWYSLEAYLRLTRRGEVAEAKKLFATANAKGAKDAECRIFPLLLAEMDGNTAEAERLRRRALEAWPKSEELDRVLLREPDESVAAAEWSRRELAEWEKAHDIPSNQYLATYDLSGRGERLQIAVRAAQGQCLLAKGMALEAARVLKPCVGGGRNFHSDCIHPLIEAGVALAKEGQVQEAAEIFHLVEPSSASTEPLFEVIEAKAPGTVKKKTPVPIAPMPRPDGN